MEKVSLNNLVLIFLILLIWVIPSLYLSNIHYIDPFFWWPLSSVAEGIACGYLQIEYPLQPEYEIILYIIADITGLSPLQIATLPIGAFIVPICYFAFSRKILGSFLHAILLTTYIALDFSIYPGHYNTFAYTWTRSLFLSFLLLSIYYTQNHRRKIIIPLILIFITVYNLHPTYTFWIFSFVIFLSLLVFGYSKYLNDITLKPPISLAIILTVIYISFNTFYRVYMRRIISLEPGMISDLFISTIESFLGIRKTSLEPYALPNQPPTQTIGYLVFLRTLIILITLIVEILLFYLKNRYDRYKFKVNSEILLAVTLLLVGVSHVVGYALYGHMSLRFIVFMYPIATILVLKNLNINTKIRRLISILLLILLISLAIIQNVSFIIEYKSTTKDTIYFTKQTYIWISGVNAISSIDRVLSDFETSQILYFYFRSKNMSFVQKFYNSDIYGIITNLDEVKIKETYDYQLINRLTINLPTTSVGWKVYKPLLSIIDRIYYANTCKIYDNGVIIIFKS